MWDTQAVAGDLVGKILMADQAFLRLFGAHVDHQAIVGRLLIPCFCVSPTSTIDMGLPCGDDIPIEERAPEEVTVIRGQRIAPEGVPVANIAFDVTPRRYLSGIITEWGIAYPPFDVSLPRIMGQGE